jgi:hypothetical protein
MSDPVKVGTPGQIKATRALLKFCREHHHAPYWIKSLEECLAALEEKKGEEARNIRERFARAGMGSYLDWYPDVVFPHEDYDYVEAVWHGLDGYWREMMRPFESKHR